MPFRTCPNRLRRRMKKPPPVPCGAFFVDPPIRWGPPARVMDPTTLRRWRGWACMRRTLRCQAPWQVDIGPTKKYRPVTYTAEVLPSLAVPPARSSPYPFGSAACRLRSPTYITCADSPVSSASEGLAVAFPSIVIGIGLILIGLQGYFDFR